MTNRTLSTNLPMAARKQVREADRIIAELNTPPAQGAPPAEPAPPAPPTPPDPILPNVGEPLPPDAQPVNPAAAPAAAQQPGESNEDYKKRYDVLQGKYNKELGQMRQQLNQQAQQNSQLQAQLNQVLTAQAVAAAAPPAAPVPPEARFAGIVSDKEREEYGTELIDMVARIAAATGAPEVQKLRQDVDGIRTTVGNVAQHTAEQARQDVYDSLHRDIGDKWVEINNSDEFVAWLQGTDVFSGASRHSALTQAFETNNAPRVVGIFKAYIDGNTAPGSTSRTPAVARETLIAPAPGQGGNGAAPGATGGRIWSEQEITDFYHRAQRKRIPEAEYVATQKEISKALAEGRVRPNRPDQHLLNNGR